MEEFSSKKIPLLKLACPNCGAKNPSWSYHDSYSRSLISYENKAVVIDTIDIPRIICSSCKHTHAILPEIIIPFNSHSLLFILSVLKDHFLTDATVTLLCEKYQISISALYRWKELLITHKRLWLGVIENIYKDMASFLSSIPNLNTSLDLFNFFRENNYSFLQSAGKTAHFSSA